MEWLTKIGAFADGLSPIQKVTYLVAATGAVIGLVFGLIIAAIRTKAALTELATALRLKKLHDRAQSSGLTPDFSREDIQRAISGYVVPDCADTDPANAEHMHRAAAIRQPVFVAVDSFVDKSDINHLLVLADTGMGKTTFCLNYFDRVNKLHKKSGSLVCAVIPLGRDGAVQKIKAIPAKNETILILDALDEDVDAADDVAGRLSILMNEAASFRFVIVTCRSQFFRDDSAIPNRTGIRIVRPRKGGLIGEHLFKTMYLQPFDECQIRKFVHIQFPLSRFDSIAKRKKAYEIIGNIPELSVRPMLLSLLPELVKEKTDITRLYDLYSYMINSWLRYEAVWIEPDYLRAVSKELAVFIYTSRKNRHSERISLAELHDVAEKVGAPRNIWNRLSARSLLNRDSDGGIKFSHRSIMEYFFVQAAIDGDDRCFDSYWTDFMRDLFVSWGNSDSGNDNVGRAQDILKLDLESMGLSPLSQPLAGPADYSAKNYVQKQLGTGRRIAASWRTHSIKLMNASGQRVLQDDEFGLVWAVPPASEYGEASVRPMSYVEMTKGSVVKDLASRDQFLSLLEAERITNDDLVPRDIYLWLGDTVGGKPVVVSISAQAFALSGVRVLGSFDIKDRHGMPVWAYAVETRPTKFAEKVKRVTAIATKVSEIDWQTGQRMHRMSEEELLEYIEGVFDMRVVKSQGRSSDT